MPSLMSATVLVLGLQAFAYRTDMNSILDASGKELEPQEDTDSGGEVSACEGTYAANCDTVTLEEGEDCAEYWAPGWAANDRNKYFVQCGPGLFSGCAYHASEVCVGPVGSYGETEEDGDEDEDDTNVIEVPDLPDEGSSAPRGRNLERERLEALADLARAGDQEAYDKYMRGRDRLMNPRKFRAHPNPAMIARMQASKAQRPTRVTIGGEEYPVDRHGTPIGVNLLGGDYLRWKSIKDGAREQAAKRRQEVANAPTWRRTKPCKYHHVYNPSPPQSWRCCCNPQFGKGGKNAKGKPMSGDDCQFVAQSRCDSRGAIGSARRYQPCSTKPQWRKAYEVNGNVLPQCLTFPGNTADSYRDWMRTA